MRALLVATVLLAVSGTGVRANLIQNGDFSAGSLTNFKEEFIPENVPNVITPVGSFEVVANVRSLAANFRAGSHSVEAPFGGFRLSQTIVSDAGTLELSIDVASYGGYIADPDGGRYSLLLDGVALASFTTGAIGPWQIVRGRLSASSIIQGGSHIAAIEIVRSGLADIAAPLQFLDNFTANLTSPAATKIPEPLSIALIGIGIATVLALPRRSST